MIVATFRTRLTPEAQMEYPVWAKRMTGFATAMPGYISHKLFVAEDGERLMLVEFESEEHLHAWAVHPEHVLAKKKGRQSFYSEYQSRVYRIIKESNFKRPATQ